MSDNSNCNVPIKMLLTVAHRLYSHDKVPLALALMHLVLAQHPENDNARMLYSLFIGAMPADATSRVRRLFYDPETNTFFVGDKDSDDKIPFKTLEDAERYLLELRSADDD